MTYHFSGRLLFYVVTVYPLQLAFSLNVTFSHTLITVVTPTSLVKVVLITLNKVKEEEFTCP